MGTVWGVAITAAIVQTTLKTELPGLLGNIPNKTKAKFSSLRLHRAELWLTVESNVQVIDEIRHSVTALKDLSPSIRASAQIAYYHGIRYAFVASTGVAALAVVASFFANGRGLRSTSD